MISTAYRKKAFILKIPLHPPFPKGDNKDVAISSGSFYPLTSTMSQKLRDFKNKSDK